MTIPPLQPRPATTGALDLMLPLQPKLLPGYNLQSSYLSSTLSTVRPPDLPLQIKDIEKDIDMYKRKVEIILESQSPTEKITRNDDEDILNVSIRKLDKCQIITNQFSDSDNSSLYKNEINSNVIESSFVDSTTESSINDDSPNNNSH